jgi:hypothetical protein
MMFGWLEVLSVALELNKFRKFLQREARDLVNSLKSKTVEEIESRFLEKPIPVGRTQLGQLVLLVSLSNQKPTPLMFHLTSFKTHGKQYIIWGGVLGVRS